MNPQSWVADGPDATEAAYRLADLSAGDVEDLRSLCLACIYWEVPEEFDRGPSPSEMQRLKEEWLAANAGTAPLGRVIRAGSQPVAFVQFGPPELYPQQLTYKAGPASHDALLITCLFVKLEYRGRGLARRLLSEAEDAARRAGYSALETYARRGSGDNPSGPVGLYLDRGFAVVRDGEFPLVRRALPARQSSPGTPAATHP